MCGSEHEYLHQLAAAVRSVLGPATYVYTTDPPWLLTKGSMPGTEVYSCVPQPRRPAPAHLQSLQWRLTLVWPEHPNMLALETMPAIAFPRWIPAPQHLVHLQSPTFMNGASWLYLQAAVGKWGTPASFCLHAAKSLESSR